MKRRVTIDAVLKEELRGRALMLAATTGVHLMSRPFMRALVKLAEAHHEQFLDLWEVEHQSNEFPRDDG